jgi:serine/threonine protein kinase
LTAERWTVIRQLYDAARELPPEAREAFVREQAGSDRSLCEEMLAMLRNPSEDSGLLNAGPVAGLCIEQVLRTEQGLRTRVQALAAGVTLCGRYRIVDLIGAGGMGEVYEAEDIELGQRVALKTMRVEDPAALARFKREIQLARTVTHPNVCRIFDLHRHHDPRAGNAVTFLTMELVRGETLSEFLARRGALTATEALPIARQIGAALAAAHEKGVVHRDLKSANVMLTDNGARAVVTDFGLAHTLTGTDETSVTIAGTPACMARTIRRQTGYRGRRYLCVRRASL